MGETLHFYVSNFSLYTGATEEDMTITHKLSSIDKTSMSLRDIRDGQDVVYKFSRVGEWTLPEVTEPGLWRRALRRLPLRRRQRLARNHAVPRRRAMRRQRPSPIRRP